MRGRRSPNALTPYEVGLREKLKEITPSYPDYRFAIRKNVVLCFDTFNGKHVKRYADYNDYGYQKLQAMADSMVEELKELKASGFNHMIDYLGWTEI